MAKYRDDVCRIGKCPNHPCKGLCPLLVTVNGKTARKEPLARDIFTDVSQADQDYNTILAERISDHNERVDNIKNIPDKRKRFIAAGLSVNLTKTDIARFMQLSRVQIWNISKKGPKKSAK